MLGQNLETKNHARICGRFFRRTGFTQPKNCTGSTKATQYMSLFILAKPKKTVADMTTMMKGKTGRVL